MHCWCAQVKAEIRDPEADSVLAVNLDPVCAVMVDEAVELQRLSVQLSGVGAKYLLEHTKVKMFRDKVGVPMVWVTEFLESTHG